MRMLTPNRWIVALLLSGTFLLPSRAAAQDDNAPLGDVARSFRKKPAPADAVIDNDNLSKVADDAATRRAGGAPLFALVPADKSFHVSSPDVTCSLSFTAKTTSPFADPQMLDDLPRTELAKLDGPATIDGDSLQVSMHNGTSWDLREIVIGLTIVRQSVPPEASSSFSQPRIVPAAGFSAASSAALTPSSQNLPDSYQKQPDVTMLLHVKGSAAPSTTATFRTPLNFALFPDQEWHWAIVKAKGIPPQAPPELTTMMQNKPATQPALAPPEAGTKLAPPIPPPSNKLPPSQETPAH